MAMLWRILGLLAFGLAFAGPVAAEEAAIETRIGEEGFVSPPATLEQVDWLAGQWVGGGIGGAPAMESWLPATGGTMVGTFVQETADGAIMFTEHMYLTQENGSLALKIKHFNADLTGWEEKDDMLTFRLVAIEPCAAYFNALTLRCADRDNPGAGLVAAVRMQSDKPEVQELVFRFNQLGTKGRTVCPGAETTLAMNTCFADRLSEANERRTEYFAAAIQRETESAKETARLRDLAAPDLSVVNQMEASERAFDAYVENECGAVWETYKGGTIRTVMAIACKIDLVDERTHSIWQNWLTYHDSTPPILPEPSPTR
ncbi:MAG: DUF6265 family protein [Erythrobacter sp.]